MYGASSVPFSHAEYFEQRHRGIPMWIPRAELHYDIAVPAGDDLDEIGARIMKDAGLEGSYGTYRPNDREIVVYVYTFWKSAQAKYHVDQKRLVVEDRRFRWDHFLTGMHARGGYDHPAFLEDSWAVVVDLVCLGFLIWIASGIYMWWQLRRTRFWGALALGSGVALFLVFVLAL
jgi:hypothetical protein